MKGTPIGQRDFPDRLQMQIGQPTRALARTP